MLDFQKQGFLDTFTLDFFLRSLVEKIQSHAGEDEEEASKLPSVGELRVSITCVHEPPSELTVWYCSCRRKYWTL